jgi:hypothetical protein
MTHEQHKARHRELHEAFDELIADYLRWHRGSLPSTTTCMDLMKWSFDQTKEPTQDASERAHIFTVCAHCGELLTEERHVCTPARKAGR